MSDARTEHHISHADLLLKAQAQCATLETLLEEYNDHVLVC